MTREHYLQMTQFMRHTLRRLPSGEKLTRLPTLLCVISYLAVLVYLVIRQDVRLIRCLLVPAACFFICTVLRPWIGRQRPYDRFQAEPIGSFTPGKGKSMPSRHTTSAVAIALAVTYVFPVALLPMTLLCLVIAALRVLCGQHDLCDVLVAIALSLILSLVGYSL